MKTTIELLDKAMQHDAAASHRALSQRIGLSPTTLTEARRRGSLSPVVAGQLAELIGEDVEHWIALAALEASPKSRVTDHLRRAIRWTKETSSKV